MKSLLAGALSRFAPAILLVPTLLFAHQAAIAQEEDFSLRIGQRAWLTSGNSDFNIAAPSGVPNILSELTWDDVNSTVIEFTAHALFFKRYSLSADVGLGAISGGTLRDQDFLGNNRTMLSSDTISAADDDDLFYVNIDFGYRILSWAVRDNKPRSSVDLLLGYQHWWETYIATKTIDLFPGTRTIDPGKALTEEFTWDSLRVGARANIQILPKLSWRARLVVLPWTRFELEDIHHLRTDLKQDPSFEATADGGFGVQFDATLSYLVWRGLSIEAGYQVWDIRSGEGTITARSLLLGDVREPLNEANSTRHGAMVGINYRF